MRNKKHSEVLGIILILFGVFLIACWMGGWFEKETLQWLWILLLYFWIGHMSGELASLYRMVSWGFETGFVGSDSINTRNLIIVSPEGKGGIALGNNADGVVFSIQDGKGEQIAAMSASELALLIMQHREKTGLEVTNRTYTA